MFAHTEYYQNWKKILVSTLIATSTPEEPWIIDSLLLWPLDLCCATVVYIDPAIIISSPADECGIVAQVSAPLAKAEISTYYICTFYTDHTLVSERMEWLYCVLFKVYLDPVVYPLCTTFPYHYLIFLEGGGGGGFNVMIAQGYSQYASKLSTSVFKNLSICLLIMSRCGVCVCVQVHVHYILCVVILCIMSYLLLVLNHRCHFLSYPPRYWMRVQTKLFSCSINATSQKLSLVKSSNSSNNNRQTMDYQTAQTL